MSSCPCGSGNTYTACCRQYHEGKTVPSAEALMRSRYSAYVRQLGAYLHRSWHPSTRPSKKHLKNLDETQWVGLDIVRTEAGSVFDNDGVVEFIARYQDPQGQIQQMHEVSRFCKQDGKWYYLDASH